LPLVKLVEFFSAEDYTTMSYYNCCGIRPKHSNISKRVGEGVFTICVVLDQSTVIFQKAKGGGGYYNLCGIEIKIVAMLCFISWLLICRVCSHPTVGGFQSPLLTNKAT
jgi:hypothetical protein